MVKTNPKKAKPHYIKEFSFFNLKINTVGNLRWNKWGQIQDGDNTFKL